MQKKEKKTELSLKKSRAKYAHPPEALEIFIGWDNAIPPNVQLPDWSTIWDKYKLGQSDEENPFLKASQQTFNECFQHFSEENKTILKTHFYIEFIQPNSPEKSREELEGPILFYALSAWYPNYLQRRKDLRRIAKFFLHLRSNDYESAGESSLKTKDGEVVA